MLAVGPLAQMGSIETKSFVTSSFSWPPRFGGPLAAGLAPAADVAAAAGAAVGAAAAGVGATVGGEIDAWVGFAAEVGVAGGALWQAARIPTAVVAPSPARNRRRELVII